MKQWMSLAAAICFAGAAWAQTLDKIVAVVDRDLILQSELDAQIQFFVLNNKVDAKTPGLRDQVLQSMINEKLVVAKAIEDSVVVTDDEVQAQLDQVIQQRVQQMGSEAKLEEAYGMPLSRIKREYRDEMRKNMLAQKLQQQRFGNTQIGRFEVEEFFKTYADSLPKVQEQVEIAHILIKPKVSEAARTAAKKKLQGILDSIKAGGDFAAFARRYSQDPGSAQQGGDLGLVRRGLFVKEFETAVFALAEKEISGIVETQYGFHIIQLIERRGDAVHARHILIRVERTKDDDSLVIAQLDSIRTRALAGESFAELAKKYSEDKESNFSGGTVGTIETEQLTASWYPTVAKLSPGEISKPERLQIDNSTYGFHIVLLKKRIPAHVMTLEQDYHNVEAIALNYKRTKDYQKWLQELRSSIYWQIRP